MFEALHCRTCIKGGPHIYYDYLTHLQSMHEPHHLAEVTHYGTTQSKYVTECCEIFTRDCHMWVHTVGLLHQRVCCNVTPTQHTLILKLLLAEAWVKIDMDSRTRDIDPASS